MSNRAAVTVPMIPGLITDGLRRILSRDRMRDRRGGQRSGVGAALRLRTSVPVGHFSLVGLSEVRERLGPRWPELSERVHALAESVISRSLLPGDVFERHDEDSYVVLYAQLGQKEADFKSRALGREITRRLLGEDCDALANVRTACVSLPVEAASGPDPEAALSAALKNARGSISTSADVRPSEPASIHAEALHRTAPEGQARERAEASPLKHARAQPSLIVTPIGRAPAAWYYSPIWDFSHRVMIHFRLLSAEDAGKIPAQPKPSLQMICEADCVAVRKAVADLIELAGQGKRFSIVCPVRAVSIGHPVSRRELIKAIVALPDPLRRLLTIELTIPPAMPVGAPLDKFIETVKGLQVGLSSRVPTATSSLALFHPALLAVTADVTPGATDERQLIELLAAFSSRAQSQGLAAGVAGLRSRSLILAATSHGFRYLSGSAVRPELESITRATKFDLAELYRA